jgi:hypothetical protein
MTVPVMEIGIMRVTMDERLMPVPMAVGFARRVIRPVRVLMVLVMRMPVLVLDRLVLMLMLVAFGQMQP